MRQLKPFVFHEPIGTDWFQRRSHDAGKRSKTRALILDTAVAVFSEKGIEASSIIEVAGRASLSNAAFYYHFKNKNELLTAVAGAVSAALIDEVDQRMSPITDGAERIALGTQFLIWLASSDWQWGTLYVLALGDLGEFRAEISKGVAKAVQLGREQGLFDVNLDDQLSASLLGIVRVAVQERLRNPQKDGIEEIAAWMTLRSLGVERTASIAIARSANETLRDLIRDFTR